MKLSKHIVSKFLLKDWFQKALVMTQKEQATKQLALTGHTLDEEKEASIAMTMTTKEGHKKYLVTQSVINLFSDFKVNEVDWTIFNNISKEQKLFILPDNSFVMLTPDEDVLRILILKYIPDDPEQDVKYTISWVNTIDGTKPSFFVPEEEELFIFKLLCFMYLTENEELPLPSKQKYGTKKTSPVLNDTPFSVIIINSKWNKTVIRTEGFAVRGHFALRKTGTGRTQSKIVFIEPFEKKGYKRNY